MPIRPNWSFRPNAKWLIYLDMVESPWPPMVFNTEALWKKAFDGVVQMVSQWESLGVVVNPPGRPCNQFQHVMIRENPFGWQAADLPIGAAGVSVTNSFFESQTPFVSCPSQIFLSRIHFSAIEVLVRVILHEGVGHPFGAVHSNDVNSIMYKDIRAGTGYWDGGTLQALNFRLK